MAIAFEEDVPGLIAVLYSERIANAAHEKWSY